MTDEPLVGQVADARREPEAQEVAQGEDVVGESAGVRVVLLDAKVGLVVEQAVEHVRGVTDVTLMTLVWNGAYWSETCV